MNRTAILTTCKELEEWKRAQTDEIAFVPTMGGLHHGHRELIVRAQKSFNNKSNVVLVSIFVNPLQFSANEDFEQYPRNLKRDSELAHEYGANAIWAPTINEIFPNGFKNYFSVKAPYSLKKNLCGSRRKDHFDGVATIMLHLLKTIKPNLLVLGEKDWQQLIIIRCLIKDFGLPIKIKSVATVRDKDGLAASSRNIYLNDIERDKAISFPKELKKAAIEASQGKVIDIKKINDNIIANGLSVEYLEIVEPFTLQIIKNVSRTCILAGAVKCGETRLIDHQFLMKRKPIVAIDGPAGAGKSTVTKSFAKQTGLTYLDTGSMYRALTLFIQRNKIDLEKVIEIKKILEEVNLEIEQKDIHLQKIILNGNDVSDAIRSPEVTACVSEVAANRYIREFLTSQQKKMGRDGGLVAEGRDIGTTIFPDADLKIFLTASVTERAKRRYKDLKNRGFELPDIKTLEQDISNRDQQDRSRKISPLIKAEDAIEIITDKMTQEEVVEEIFELFKYKIPQEIWPTKF